jgi:hypothetical protein
MVGAGRVTDVGDGEDEKVWYTGCWGSFGPLENPMVEVAVGTNLYSCCLVGFFLDKMRSTRTFRMESTYYSRHKRWWLDPSISISLWPFLHISFYTIPIFLFWKLKGLSIYTGTTVYKPVPHHPNFFHCSFELHACRQSRSSSYLSQITLDRCTNHLVSVPHSQCLDSKWFLLGRWFYSSGCSQCEVAQCECDLHLFNIFLV